MTSLTPAPFRHIAAFVPYILIIEETAGGINRLYAMTFDLVLVCRSSLPHTDALGSGVIGSMKRFPD